MNQTGIHNGTQPLVPNEDELRKLLIKIKDGVWVFLYPTISTFGTITNLINIIIFASKELRGANLYRYMLIFSIADFFYVAQIIFIFLPRCASYCSTDIGNSLIGRIYNLYSWDYMTTVLAIFMVFVEIAMTTSRLIIVANFKMFRNVNAYIVCAVLFIVSIFYYSVNIITKTIKPVAGTNHTKYRIVSHPWLKTSSYKAFSISLYVIRGPIALAVLILLNILTAYFLHKHMSKKLKIRGVATTGTAVAKGPIQAEATTMGTNHAKLDSNETKASRNATKMVMYLAVVFIAGNMPVVATFILGQFVSTSGLLFIYFAMVSNIILLVSHGSYIFIYYHFNKVYKRKFDSQILFWRE
jgi:hypothetical protein